MRLTAHAGFGGRLHGPAVQPTLHALRHGAMRLSFAGVRAPSTLGSFLRSFTWGNGTADEECAPGIPGSASPSAPLLPGRDVLAFVDLDSQQKRFFGHHNFMTYRWREI